MIKEFDGPKGSMDIPRFYIDESVKTYSSIDFTKEELEEIMYFFTSDNPYEEDHMADIDYSILTKIRKALKDLT
jgi:hypothetical protein